MLSDEILKQYRDTENKRMVLSEKIDVYGDIKAFDLMNKCVVKYNNLTDKLDKLDEEYQKTKRIEIMLSKKE